MSNPSFDCPKCGRHYAYKEDASGCCNVEALERELMQLLRKLTPEEAKRNGMVGWYVMKIRQAGEKRG